MSKKKQVRSGAQITEQATSDWKNSVDEYYAYLQSDDSNTNESVKTPETTIVPEQASQDFTPATTDELKLDHPSMNNSDRPMIKPASQVSDLEAREPNLIEWIADVFDAYPQMQQDLQLLRACPLGSKLPLLAAAGILIFAALKQEE